MAATNGVWGIDVGHCALKALRCEYDDQGKILMATAFDYVEYPKILSQPDANPRELIREALAQFLERNELAGDKVAISVAGQNGLSRFFQPPPVDLKRLPEIVAFEAKQQIPFPLGEVIWDFQMMGGANEVDGFLMEAEVGLFAMKRDQVYETLEPFRAEDVEVDLIQLAPLCAYNFVSHNLMTEELEADIYDPDNPPESVVIVNMGTDTTDLVITNGFRVWQRNIPLGGNHFTKQLTKELKLTFTKAEHLKRNVREAEDAKAVIQALRPVFNDLLTEVQRSIGFFQNIDRKAEINGLIMLGNAVKLPGLQQYLAKNLGYELIDVKHESWSARLSGQSVLTSPQFKDNMHAFGVCYGLCLQGLGRAKLNTNLLPKELLTERVIRAKKPWALAIAASLMLAFAVNFFFEYRDWYKVHLDRDFDGVTWTAAMSAVDTVQTKADSDKNEDAQLVQRLDELVALGHELSGNSDRRLLWPELMKAINVALPNKGSPNVIPDPRVTPISQRQDIHIEYIESQYFPDLQAWFTKPVKYKYMLELARLEGIDVGETADDPALLENPVVDGTTPPDATATPGAPPAPDAPAIPAAPGASAAPEGAAPAGDSAVTGLPGIAEDPVDPEISDAMEEAGLSAESITGPEGPGWVIEIKGHHFYNADENMEKWGGVHLRNTFLKNLREQKIALPMGPGQPLVEFTMEELGVGYTLVAVEGKIDFFNEIPNPFYEGRAGASGSMYGEGMMSEGGPPGVPGFGVPPQATPRKPGAAEPETEEPPEPMAFEAPKYTFVIQFCWQEVQLAERLRRRQEQLEQQRLEEEQAQPPDTQPAPPADGVAATNVGG